MSIDSVKRPETCAAAYSRQKTLRQTSEVYCLGFCLLRCGLLQRRYPRIDLKIWAVFYRSKFFVLHTKSGCLV